MKTIKITLFSILVLMSTVAFAQEKLPIVISGEITGLRAGRGGGGGLTFSPVVFSGERLPITVTDGCFEFTTYLDGPKYNAAINVGNNTIHIVVVPGGRYRVKINMESERLGYEILGDNVAESNWLKEYQSTYHTMERMLHESSKFGNFNDHKAYVDARHKELENKLLATKNAGFISESKTRIDKKTAFYYYYYAFAALQRTGQVVNEPDFDTFLSSPLWRNLSEETLDELNSTMKYATIIGFSDVDVLDMLKTYKKCLFNQNVLNRAVTTAITDYFSRGGQGDIHKIYEYYTTICTDKGVLTEMAKNYENAAKLVAGVSAPDFTMMDIAGKEIKFSDLKGKVIYVDVWATWCGPCKVQIPYFAKLAERFKNDKRIAFVSISIDDNHDAWKNMVSEEKPEWPQYIVQGGARSDLSQKYQINSIPRFMLFDREGKIINVNASSPSREDMAEYLQELIGENNVAESNASNSFKDFYGKWRGQNKIAPDFTAHDIDGNTVRLSDFRGKVVVLDFWFTTCHMCIKGFPALNELAAKYAPQDLIVLAVGTPEKREDFEKFVRENRETYPNLVWLQDRSTQKFEEGFAHNVYGMFGAPSQIIINKDGIVVSATNFKEQIICALPLAGIEVDEEELKQATAEAKMLEDRIYQNRAD